jgi:hypothetical protein
MIVTVILKPDRIFIHGEEATDLVIEEDVNGPVVRMMGDGWEFLAESNEISSITVTDYKKSVGEIGESETKDKIRLVTEAIKDWRSGQLGDLAAMVAISVVVSPIHPNQAMVEDAKKWYDKHTKEARDERAG